MVGQWLASRVVDHRPAIGQPSANHTVHYGQSVVIRIQDRLCSHHPFLINPPRIEKYRRACLGPFHTLLEPKPFSGSRAHPCVRLAHSGLGQGIFFCSCCLSCVCAITFCLSCAPVPLHGWWTTVLAKNIVLPALALEPNMRRDILAPPGNGAAARLETSRRRRFASSGGAKGKPHRCASSNLPRERVWCDVLYTFAEAKFDPT